MKKVINIITASVFFLIIGGFFLANLFTPDSEISKWERRSLASMPELSAETLLSGEYFTGFQLYADDQFVLRDKFREINSAVRTKLLMQSDVNGLYTEKHGPEGEYIFSIDADINEKSISHFISKTNSIIDTYLNESNNIYVSVVPEKSYYGTSSHPKADAEKIASLYSLGVGNAQYIDIFGALSLDCYYRTDSHWSQDKLDKVMETFAEGMGMDKNNLPDFSKTQCAGEFYGVYYGQLAAGAVPDKMYYVTDKTAGEITENLDHTGGYEIYSFEQFESTDPYNFYMQGATPLSTAVNEDAATDKELVIFRDSFGSAIAPLFLGEYKSVTLIDLRYISSAILSEYVDFENKNVLFLYSTTVLNSNIVLK